MMAGRRRCRRHYLGGVTPLALSALLLAIAPHRASAIDTGERAHSLLDAAHDWHDLYRAFLELRESDDGDVAERISEFVVHRLATRWESFPELATIARVDTAFGSWVVGHIDATTGEDDLACLVRHASARGPRRCEVLRERVLRAAREAYEDVRRDATPPRYVPGKPRDWTPWGLNHAESSRVRSGR